MKVATVVGARPQFIKAAVVSRALRARGIEETLIHTGQHYDDNMSHVFFEELDIPLPDHCLGVGSGTHGFQTGLMLQALEPVLVANEPDYVIVYGDTNSTLAGALVAAKLNVSVVHVEAGLRSFNRRMPEEINRVLTDHASDILLAPTELSVQNLCREGISPSKIHLVGDVMYDAALYYAAKAEAESTVLKRLGLEHNGYTLATIHRAENTNDSDRLRVLWGALTQLSERHPVILPLHPRTRTALEREGIQQGAGRIHSVDPVGYLDMVMLEKNARLIATDSGGVQKEAFFYGVPCVTLREETEWVELVELGWNRLAPPRTIPAVVAEFDRALQSVPSAICAPYGNGHASEKIAEILQARVEGEEVLPSGRPPFPSIAEPGGGFFRG